MEIATVKGESREIGGRTANNRIRRRGMLPAIIYGHGEAPQAVSLLLHDLENALARMTHVINLEIGGRAQQYLVKDVQYDHLMKTPIHVDLMRVDPNERVHVRVGVELRGNPRGLTEGGEMVQLISDLEIECPLLAIPEILRPKIDHLHVNDALHVRDLELPEGVRALQPPDTVICHVRTKKLAVETPAVAVAEGGPSEPEMIGRVAKEETAEGEEK